jgi:hypothetical protein
MKLSVRLGHITTHGSKAELFHKSLEQIWTIADHFFKFSTWLVATSLVKYAYDQSGDVWLYSVFLLMMILLTLVINRAFTIVFEVTPKTAYTIVISFLLSVACSVALFLVLQSAIYNIVNDLVKLHH